MILHPYYKYGKKWKLTVYVSSPGSKSQTHSALINSDSEFSRLFQRCSLPENLWTALIQLWTTLNSSEMKGFGAKN